jgi:hypothetical protein
VAGEPAPAKDDDRAGRLREMKTIARSIRLSEVGSDDPKPVPMHGEPLHRWSDPARKFHDGTLWAWTRGGRPIALLTLEFYPVSETLPNRSRAKWSYEIISMTARNVSANGGNGVSGLVPGTQRIEGDGIHPWTSWAAGVTMRPFPDAAEPAKSEVERLRQMKDLTKRVSACEFYGTDHERFELRLLPRPVHRYAEPASGLLDGAIFLFAYGTNPEIMLVIEGHQRGSSPPRWEYGTGQLTSAEPAVSIDRREVWTRPRQKGIVLDDNYANGVVVRKPSSESSNFEMRTDEYGMRN